VDYSHPFGGESLFCDTQVVAIERRQASPHQEMPDSSAAASAQPDEKPANPQIAQNGDMATVACTARLKSGEIVWTTRQDFAEDPKQKKIEKFRVPEIYGPQTVMVGAEDLFPGLEGAVAGMELGDGKNITVPAAKVFGDRNPGLMRKYDRTKTIPVRMTLPAQTYVKQFGGFPVPGKKVKVNAYATGTVVDVTEQGAVLELAPVSEEEDSDFGLTRMKVVGDRIQIHLTPKLGADFNLEDKKGIVVAVDDRQFTVDFNKPLAGEDVELHVQLIGLAKASRFAGMEIDWIEDYYAGLEAAEEHNKPTVLVLYADWCSYCKKLFNTTLVDPRIKMMHDDFVWVKANSDKEKSLKMLYEQKGFPLTVVLDSCGEVMGTINGFRPAGEYGAELKKLLKAGHKAAVKDDGAVGSGG
jgi:FKBP-type peptidyl-prolyl cis-trans isomerase 2